jgi:hypothetical protein|tara:strand:- start:17 stop:523 length:507 start_codon:yes stop_codon:yes gene_type:complete
VTDENDKRFVNQRVSSGVTSLRSRLEILEKEIAVFMELSMEKRVIMRLMPVLNQALTRYIDEKIQRAVRRDRILQAFVPALSDLDPETKADQPAIRMLERLRDHLVECAEGHDKEELIDRLELAQLKAKDSEHLAGFLRLIFGHHVVRQLFVELELIEYVQSEYRSDP